MPYFFWFPGENLRGVWVMSAYDCLGSLLSIVANLIPGAEMTL